MATKTSVSITYSLYERLRALAHARGSSVSGVVETLCAVCLDSFGEGNEIAFPPPGPRGRKKGSVNKLKAIMADEAAAELTPGPTDAAVDATMPEAAPVPAAVTAADVAPLDSLDD